MRTTIVTGLLGSGKTTFVRSFLKGGREKAVVLVNDFGQAGIDGEIISAGGIEAIELPSGCVCCTLRFDLITTLQRAVREFSPDHLVIEPSGVASPSGVLEALESAGIGSATVVGIVDAVEFAELYGSGMYGSFLREQVERSDVLLVNKVDIAREEAIAAAERLIQEINPRAVLMRTVNAVLEHPLPLGERTEVRGGVREVNIHPLPLRERPAPESPGQGGGARGAPGKHFCFETHSFTLQQRFPLSTFRTLISDLALGLYGNVVRAKALVQTDEGPYRFDLVYGRVDAAPFGQEIAGSRLVVIGEGLKEEGLRRAVSREGA